MREYALRIQLTNNWVFENEWIKCVDDIAKELNELSSFNVEILDEIIVNVLLGSEALFIVDYKGK